MARKFRTCEQPAILLQFHRDIADVLSMFKFHRDIGAVNFAKNIAPKITVNIATTSTATITLFLCQNDLASLLIGDRLYM